MEMFISNAIVIVDSGSVRKEKEKIPIIGKKFGVLTPYEKVYGRYKKDNKTVILYKCHCDCGNDVLVTKSKLLHSKKLNCEKRNLPNEKQIRHIGKRLGMLVVQRSINNGRKYVCKCDCGNSITVKYETVKRGVIKDCGCQKVHKVKAKRVYGNWEVLCRDSLNKFKWHCRCTKCDRVQSLTSDELNIKNLAICKNCKEKENKSAKNSRIHTIWMCMKARCKGTGGQNTVRYYAGRGIKYQESWEKFENFYDDMKDGYADNLQLDRIDPDGDYTKENCRWITAKENCRNRRDNTIVTAGGETHVQAWWMEKYGLSSSGSLPKRLQRDYGDDWEIVHGHRHNWLPTPRYHI